jgi:tetratricopeptide (TPR) repeat protein
MRFLLPLLSFAFIAAPSAFAQDIPLTGPEGMGRNNVVNQKKYSDCMGLVDNRPKMARNFANEWMLEYGGIPARHCRALAESALGNHDIAARDLDEMAQEFRLRKAGPTRKPLGDADADLLASFYLQAGNAWLLANQPTKAYELLSLGISEAAITGTIRMNLLVDRARSLARVDDWEAAAKDLTIALTLENTHFEALVLRASAYRKLEKFELAKSDIDNALGLDATHADGLLEAGNLALAQDRDVDARAHWLTYLRLYPEGTAIEDVRKNLEALDVKK